MSNKITAAQAVVLRRLRDAGYEAGAVVLPRDAFPSRDNQDNGARRALRALARSGVVQEIDRGFLLLTSETFAQLQALEEK